MREQDRHRIPFRLKIIRLKNSGFLAFTDRIIKKLKPSRKFSGVPKKILFIRNDRIGDAIVTLPVLRDLKLNYPDMEIHVLTSGINHFVFENQKFVDRVILAEGGNREIVDELRMHRYDAAVDLIGMKRKTAMLARRVSEFTAGARIFGFSWLYDFYTRTNWVSAEDYDFMTRKIEGFLEECFGFKFEKRDESALFEKHPEPEQKIDMMDKKIPASVPRGAAQAGMTKEGSAKDIDVLVHLGTSELRKLSAAAEEAIIKSISDKKLLITDARATERFNYYEAMFQGAGNVEFKLYPHIKEIATDSARARLLLCYDGGQAHYLSQFTKAVVIIGTVSAVQWKPYEFAEYELTKEWDNGVKAIRSMGKMGHTVIYYPIWCSPCFNIGCETKPCLNNIKPEQVLEIVEKALS